MSSKISTGSESGSESIRWNAVALVGRQIVLIGVAFVLAALLGPTAYGIVAQANVYITLAGLVLDQGISAALISKQSVGSRQLGAVMTVNLLLGTLLAAATVMLAIPVADFFDSEELSAVLAVLGIGMIFKGATVVPRVILTREMRFKKMGIAEPTAAIVGGAAGLAAAVLGAGYWSLVIQMMTTDLLVLVLFAAYARPPLPNVSFGELQNLWGFSASVFAAQLVSYGSRNLDNILIGRYLGATQLAFYALSYRVLLAPIQMVGQVVTRVLFPLIVQRRNDKAAVIVLVARSEAAIATVVFPVMIVLSVASGDFVSTFLGNEWIAAVPVLSVLCITGARQAVTALNSPILMGMDRASTHLKFNLFAAAFQIGGMVIGLPFGILGVAIGYTVAGVVLTPVIAGIQKRVLGMGYRAQLKPLIGPLHASIWAALTYLVVGLTGLPSFLALSLGAIAGAAVYALVLRFVHHDAWLIAMRDAGAVLGRAR